MPDVRNYTAAPHVISRAERIQGWALRISLLLPVYFAVAALGTRFDMWDWHIGLNVLTLKIGPILLLLALLVAVVAIGVGIFQRRRALSVSGWIALLIPLMALTWANSVRSAAQKLPAIHDISTDVAAPPMFSDSMKHVRGPQANRVDNQSARVDKSALGGKWAGRLVSDAQRIGYPDIKPIGINALSPERAFVTALAAAKAIGLEVTLADQAHGHIEGTATSLWFGFKDDVAIRVSVNPEGGALVDIRSVSRVGVSDLGRNADRIRAFKHALEAEMEKR